MSYRIQVTVHGENRAAKRTADRARQASNFGPSFLKTFEYMEGIEKRQFNSEGLQSGDPWEPIKEATLARKLAKGQDPRILHADRILRDSLAEDGPGAIRVVTPHRAVFGTAVPWGVYHQDPNPASGTVQRKPIDLTESQRRSINRIQMHWVTNGVAKLPYAK